jgi:conjugative transfer region protein TrbK
MHQYLGPRQLLRIAAVGFIILIVALAIMHSRRDAAAGITGPLEHGKADALVSELTRCRAVTPDQTESLETCRRFWAENRRQFFSPTKTAPAPVELVPSPATTSGKNRDRFSPTDVKQYESEVR